MLILNEMRAFVAAVRLLTRVPVPSRIPTTRADMRRSLRYLPFIGAIIGVLAFLMMAIFGGALLPWSVSVFVLIAITILLTGALHEDGLADTADGIGGGHTRERALEIMRDSRIGTYGVLALILVIGMKAATLVALADVATGFLIFSAYTVSRASMVVAMWRVRPARADGLGAIFDEGPGIGSVLIALATCTVPLLGLWSVLGWQTAVAALGGAVIGHVAARLFYQPKLGGYTGDTLGAVQQVTELAMYLAAAPVLIPLI